MTPFKDLPEGRTNYCATCEKNAHIEMELHSAKKEIGRLNDLAQHCAHNHNWHNWNKTLSDRMDRIGKLEAEIERLNGLLDKWGAKNDPKPGMTERIIDLLVYADCNLESIKETATKIIGLVWPKK